MAAGNPSSSVLVTLFIFVVVFSPMLSCEAARFTNGFHRHGLYCPQCVCCAPAKPGKCCPCFCGGTLSTNGHHK
ncbi:hypothetical protein Pint_29546 [Pistacia integerrima]|uniref:Uncharacterized protein n=1 Tax=Pistacia integerrima TaxID=434235 RepID=A0ACC0X0U6_9ROSI|nr:hypothetical protein Pint_29546 [Pistacia integerrima]